MRKYVHYETLLSLERKNPLLGGFFFWCNLFPQRGANMTPEYKWNEDQQSPKDAPEKSKLQEDVWYAIDIQPALREIVPTITKIYLRYYTTFNTGVEGTARNAADEPIAAFKYSWTAGRGIACRYDDPRKAEYLNF